METEETMVALGGQLILFVPFGQSVDWGKTRKRKEAERKSWQLARLKFAEEGRGRKLQLQQDAATNRLSAYDSTRFRRMKEDGPALPGLLCPSALSSCRRGGVEVPHSVPLTELLLLATRIFLARVAWHETKKNVKRKKKNCAGGWNQLRVVASVRSTEYGYSVPTCAFLGEAV